MTLPENCTVTYNFYDRYSEDPQGYANIRVYSDEGFFLGETQVYFTLGPQSKEDIQAQVESAANQVLQEYNNHPKSAAMFELIASGTPESTGEETGGGGEVTVSLDPVLDRLNSQETTLTQELDAIDAALAAIANRSVTVSGVDVIDSRIQQIAEVLTGMSGQQSTETERTEQLAVRLDELRTTVAQIRNSLDSSSGLSTVKDQLDALAATIGSTKNDTQESLTNAQLILERVRTLGSNDETIVRDVGSVASRLQDIETATGNVNRRLVDTTDALASQQTLIQNLVAEIDLVGDNLTVVSTDLQTVEESVTQNAEADRVFRESTVAQIGTLAEAIENLRTLIDSQREDVAALSASVAAISESVQTTRGDIDTVNQSVLSLATSIETVRSEVGLLRIDVGKDTTTPEPQPEPTPDPVVEEPAPEPTPDPVVEPPVEEPTPEPTPEEPTATPYTGDYGQTLLEGNITPAHEAARTEVIEEHGNQ